MLEVGLTVVLLVGGGLLLKSYQRLRSTDIGVPVENVLTMHFSLPEVRYKQPVQQVAFFEQLIGRVRALPGVQAAGLVSTPPGEGWNGDRMMQVVEHPPLPKREVPDVMVRGAEPGYFSAIQIPLLRGRIFTLDERLQRANVAVISRSTAQTLFPNEDPIGKHLRSEEGGDVYEVVGIVGDTRWSIAQPIKPTLYWPIYGNNYSRGYDCDSFHARCGIAGLAGSESDQPTRSRFARLRRNHSARSDRQIHDQLRIQFNSCGGLLRDRFGAGSGRSIWSAGLSDHPAHERDRCSYCARCATRPTSAPDAGWMD